MKSIIRFIKKLFGQYEIGYEYWVNTKDIKVDPEWETTKIGEKKLERKMNFWYETGELESPIILDKDFNLLDGYSSVVIARMKNINRVPVHFVD